MEIVDIDALSSLLNRLSNLTGFSLTVYEKNGDIVLLPIGADRGRRSSPEDSEESLAFLKKNIEKAALRSDVSVANGFAEEHYFFVPFRLEKTAFVLVGSGPCRPSGDSVAFREGECHPISDGSSRRMNARRAEIRAADEVCLRNTARDIRSILNLVLRTEYKSILNERRYKLMKVIIGLVSDIHVDKQPDEICDILVEVIPFLFNIDSIAVLARSGNAFTARRTAGRIKDYLQSFRFEITGVLSELVERKRPVCSDSAMEILRLGLSDEVTSLYAFPIMSDETVVGVLSVFNSAIQQEEFDIISEMCHLTGFVFKLADMQGSYHRSLKEIDVLNIAAAHLIPVKDPALLYEAILDTSMRLAEAEKGSLLLVNGDAPYLTMKAARGINKRLLSEIKIRSGEGIAGKVFQEGIPLMVGDMDKEGWGLRRRPKYKTGSFISMPLKTGEKTIGVLNVSDKITGGVFSEEDLSLLRSFVSYACIALERSTYYSLASQLRELSITDPLTGLFNRRYFEERFFEELHRSERHGLSFSLAMIDIDDFKLFNDSEGHLAGDEVLKCIANIAKDCLRVSDVIARFGGEEFVVIMPQTVKSEALQVTERIRKTIKEQLPCSWRIFPQDSITVSIGIATYPSSGNDRKELIRNADRALYRAKMEGKDRTVLWLN